MASTDHDASRRPAVYRLQGIAEHVKTFEDVKNILRQKRGLFLKITGLEIFSLATNVRCLPFENTTKVATLMFSARKHHLGIDSVHTTTLSPEEIIESVNSVKDGLILDDDFLGLTPLNDVGLDGHELE
jgi:hypothetical protein